MIDFDTKFHDFYEKWIKDNQGKYTYDEMESKVGEVYDLWKNAQDSELGCSISQYLAGLTDDEVTKMFVSSFEEGLEPSSALIDEVENREACIEDIKRLLRAEIDDNIKMHISNILLEIGRAGECKDIFVEWLLDTDCSEELRDVAVEILKDYADDVYDKLMEHIDDADIDTQTLVAEVVVYAEKNDKTFDLLEKLFKSGANTALYAGYLGKYGDERAAAMLYKALDTCNYLEFTEIRNAIEVLGGVVDEEYRDFSDDEYYKAIKHLK